MPKYHGSIKKTIELENSRKAFNSHPFYSDQYNETGFFLCRSVTLKYSALSTNASAKYGALRQTNRKSRCVINPWIIKWNTGALNERISLVNRAVTHSRPLKSQDDATSSIPDRACKRQIHPSSGVILIMQPHVEHIPCYFGFRESRWREKRWRNRIRDGRGSFMR